MMLRFVAALATAAAVVAATSTPQQKWTVPFPKLSDAVAGGAVVIARTVPSWEHMTATVSAFDASNGRSLWSHGILSKPWGSGAARPVAIDATGARFFYLAARGNNLTAVNATTGTTLWSVTTPLVVFHASIMASPDARYVFLSTYEQCCTGSLVAFDAATGRQLWSGVGPQPEQSSYMPISYTTVAGIGGVVSSRHGTTYEAATGKVLWRTKGKAAFCNAAPFFAQDTAVSIPVIESSGLCANTVVAVDPATGAAKWSAPFNPNPVSTNNQGFIAAVSKSVLLGLSTEGYLFGLRLSGGGVAFNHSGFGLGINLPAMAFPGSDLVVTCDYFNGQVHGINAVSGETVWNLENYYGALATGPNSLLVWNPQGLAVFTVGVSH